MAGRPKKHKPFARAERLFPQHLFIAPAFAGLLFVAVAVYTHSLSNRAPLPVPVVVPDNLLGSVGNFSATVARSAPAYTAPASPTLPVDAVPIIAADAQHIIKNYTRFIDAVGEVQGNSYRALAAAAMAGWNGVSGWLSGIDATATALKNTYTTSEK